MSDPTYSINLLIALERHVQEQLRIKTELEGYERQAARCRDQLRATEGLIEQVNRELENANDLSRSQVAGPYDQRAPDLRPNLRPNVRPNVQPNVQSDNRYDSGYDQRRDPRYASRSEERYDSPYDRQQYRNLDGSSYRPNRPSGINPADIDEAVESLQANEMGSNVRFADFRIPQAATIVLREANCALHVSEIFRRLSQGGFEFRGMHQQITLAVSLSRSKRFRKVAPGTFELDPAYLHGQVA